MIISIMFLLRKFMSNPTSNICLYIILVVKS